MKLNHLKGAYVFLYMYVYSVCDYNVLYEQVDDSLSKNHMLICLTYCDVKIKSHEQRLITRKSIAPGFLKMLLFACWYMCVWVCLSALRALITNGVI